MTRRIQPIRDIRNQRMSRDAGHMYINQKSISYDDPKRGIQSQSSSELERLPRVFKLA